MRSIIEKPSPPKRTGRGLAGCGGWLEIGALANVELDALRFAFEIARRDTVATRRSWTSSPYRVVYCLDCAQTIAVHQYYDPCPCCGGFQWRLTGGNEMRIKELEVE